MHLADTTHTTQHYRLCAFQSGYWSLDSTAFCVSQFCLFHPNIRAFRLRSWRWTASPANVPGWSPALSRTKHFGLFLCHQRTHIKQAIKRKRSTAVRLERERDVGEEQGNHKNNLVLIKQLQDRVQQGEEENHQKFTIAKGTVVAHQGGHTLNWCFCSSWRKAHGCHRAQKVQMDGEGYLKLCACPKYHLKWKAFEQVVFNLRKRLLIQNAGHLISVCFSLQLLYSQILL